MANNKRSCPSEEPNLCKFAALGETTERFFRCDNASMNVINPEHARELSNQFLRLAELFRQRADRNFDSHEHTTLCHLNRDVLCMIFDLLPLRSRQNLRAVCKHFYLLLFSARPCVNIFFGTGSRIIPFLKMVSSFHSTDFIRDIHISWECALSVQRNTEGFGIFRNLRAISLRYAKRLRTPLKVEDDKWIALRNTLTPIRVWFNDTKCEIVRLADLQTLLTHPIEELCGDLPCCLELDHLLPLKTLCLEYTETASLYNAAGYVTDQVCYFPSMSGRKPMHIPPAPVPVDHKPKPKLGIRPPHAQRLSYKEVMCHYSVVELDGDFNSDFRARWEKT